VPVEECVGGLVISRIWKVQQRQFLCGAKLEKTKRNVAEHKRRILMDSREKATRYHLDESGRDRKPL
jgi:hypothetical protein